LCSIHHSVNSAHRPLASSRITHRLLYSLGGFRYRVHPRTKARDGQLQPLSLARLHFFDPESGDAIYGRRSARMAGGVGAERP